MHAFWNIQSEKAIEILQTNKDGLSSDQIQKRQSRYGKNTIVEKRPISYVGIFFSQFNSPLIYVLLFAAIISLFLLEYVDATIIFIAIAINTLAGFIQEVKAEKALERLKELVIYTAKVIRSGREQSISAEELVPGDIVELSAGDRVTFDGRILEATQLQINEASLTGESTPVEKQLKPLPVETGYPDQTNMVFMGTVVTAGTGLVVVTHTGSNTQFGKVSELISDIDEEKTPLQLALGKLGNMLGLVVVILSFIVFGVGLLYGQDPFDMFLTSVALAVAAIPEGLLVSLTVILATGMQRILKQKAIVRRLVAAETLGSVNYICTDKTGTLTQGKMQATSVWSPDTQEVDVNSQHSKELMPLISNSLLCNEANYDKQSQEFTKGSPTEKAVMGFAHSQGWHRGDLTYERIKLEPFDSEKKWMGVLVRQNEMLMEYVKGSPEVILNMSKFILRGGRKIELDQNQKKALLETVETMTSQGLRVLAFAQRSYDQKPKKLFEELIFTGLIGIKDPLRTEAKGAISLCKSAGIHPVIITGDHPTTARAIANDLGLNVNGEQVITGEELQKLSDKQLEERIEDISVYARVFPQQKVRLVQMLRRKGHTVAMLGDGVNDAPALKAADIGVAFGSGTDVAKEISDMVLLNNNFSVIVNAVEQGRMMFENLRKAIVYLLADSFTEIVLILGALILGLPLPITAAQILWINLLTDGFPHIALAFEKGDGTVMEEKPRDKDEPIINAEMKTIIFIIGLVTDFILLALYFYFLTQETDLAYIRTVIFSAISIASLLYVFSVRSFRKTLLQINMFSNRWLNIAVLAGLGTMIVSLYVPFVRDALELVPIGLNEWILILVLGSIKLVGIELTKWIFLVRSHKKG